MALSAGNAGKIAVILALLGLAGWQTLRFVRASRGVSDKMFFYDESAKKLFKADIQSIPPIKGVDDDREDAVRAIVVSLSGKPKDESTWKIAYLETCAPELKKSLEEARNKGTMPTINRSQGAAMRLVRRENDKQWYPANSPQGVQIMQEWLTAGGTNPEVVVP